MAPVQPDKPDEITRQIQDAIASNSSLREGLDDDAATPLVEWGAHQAAVVGSRLLSRSAVPPDEEAIQSTAYALTRLMTRITWVVTYRDKKDAAWLTRTFNKINDLSQEVYGPEAPTLSDNEIATWIASNQGQDNATLIQNLIARLTPETPATEAPPPVDEAQPAMPFNGAGLPVREAKPPSRTIDALKDLFQHAPEPDPPASTGGNIEHDD